MQPSYRRQGLASELVETVMKNACHATSATIIAVQGSQPFWKRHGFQATGKKWDSLSSSGLSAAHMEYQAIGPHARYSIGKATDAGVKPQRTHDMSSVQEFRMGEDLQIQDTCMTTIGDAFAADGSTGSLLYCGASHTHWSAFWKMLASESLASAAPGKGHGLSIDYLWLYNCMCCSLSAQCKMLQILV